MRQRYGALEGFPGIMIIVYVAASERWKLSAKTEDSNFHQRTLSDTTLSLDIGDGSWNSHKILQFTRMSEENKNFTALLHVRAVGNVLLRIRGRNVELFRIGHEIKTYTFINTIIPFVMRNRDRTPIVKKNENRKCKSQWAARQQTRAFKF